MTGETPFTLMSSIFCYFFLILVLYSTIMEPFLMKTVLFCYKLQSLIFLWGINQLFWKFTSKFTIIWNIPQILFKNTHFWQKMLTSSKMQPLWKFSKTTYGLLVLFWKWSQYLNPITNKLGNFNSIPLSSNQRKVGRAECWIGFNYLVTRLFFSK